MKSLNLKKSTFIAVTCLLLTLLIARLVAPSVVTWYANRTIAQTPGISGHVADIDLAILSGAYTIKYLNIRQTGDGQDRPLLVIKQVNISLLWSALLKGRIMGDVTFIEPRLSLYDRPEDQVFESEAVTDEKTWLGLARDLSPFSIDHLSIADGTFSMDAKSQLKRSKLTVQNIQLTMSNISNADTSSALARARFTGDIQNQAKVSVDATFDPNTVKPSFDINLQMEKLPVSYIDSMIEFYAPFDFEAGKIDLASELKSTKGKVTGYIKVGIYQLEVFSWHADVIEDGNDPLELLSDVIGGMLATLFENDNKDLIATRIPLEGSLNNPDISVLDALLGLVRNAFIKAYNLNIEDSVSDLSEPAPPGNAEKSNSQT